MDNNANPAFPVLDFPSDCTGLSKREYAAIHIMTGLASKYTYDCPRLTNNTISLVDALFDRLEK